MISAYTRCMLAIVVGHPKDCRGGVERVEYGQQVDKCAHMQLGEHLASMGILLG